MPNKQKPKKSFPYIQVRISPQDKETWIKFAKDNGFKYVSNLIRYAVDLYIKKGENIGEKQDLTPLVKELLSTLKEERNGYMQKFDEIIETSKKSEEIDVDPKHKDKFLKLLEKHSYTSEDICDIYELPEPYVLDVLKELKGLNLVKTRRFKGQILWEVINNGNSN
jgi:hypothetical protein